MKCETAIIVDNRMTCVASSLKTDNDVGFLSKHIGNLTLAFVSPVSSYYCSYHEFSSLRRI